MPSDQSFNVEGLPAELRARAQEEAARRGVPVEQGLQTRILGAADAASPEPALNATLSRLDQQLGSLMEQGRSNANELETRIAAVDRALAALDQGHPPAMAGSSEIGAYPPSPADKWGLGLDRAISEITARQRMLDDEDSPRALKQQFAALSRRLDSMAPRGAAPRSRSGDDPLRTELRQLGDDLRGLRQPGEFERAVGELRQELAEIGRKIDGAAPRHAIEAIEAEVRTLSDRVDRGRDQSEASPALARIEEVLGQLKHALTHFAPAETLAGLRAEVQALDRKIDAIATGGADGTQNAAALRQLEQAVAELGEVASHAASGEALVALAEEVQAIGDKIDRLTAAAGRERQEYTSLIDQRFRELAALLDSRAQAAFESPPDNITALVEQIAGRLDRVEVSRDHSPMLDAIATQITRLTEHVEAADTRFDALDQFERSARALLDGMEELRAGAASVAEHAARQAVAELAGQFPGAGPEVADLRQDLDTLRQSHALSDRRTQDTLEAVHDTLERLVDRLALVETGLRGDGDAPAGLPPEAPFARAEPGAAAHLVPDWAPELIPSLAPTAPAGPASAAGPLTPSASLLVGERPAPMPVDMDALVPTAPERRAIDPTLPADHPLEPGTAAARARLPASASAAERIAASEAALGPAKPVSAADAKATFIAAARRAAQAAANMAPPADAAAQAEKQTSSFSAIAKRLTGRRPLMLAFALLLGAGALQVALSAFGVFDPAPAAKPTAIAAVPVKTTPVAPAGNSPPTASTPTASASLAAPAGPILPMLAPPPKAEQPPPAPPAAPPEAPASAAPPHAMPAVSPLAISSMQLPGSPDVTGSIGRATGLAPAAAVPAIPSTPPPAATASELPPSFGKGLRAAALAGQAAAEYEVATRFAEGRGVAPNFEEAARWFERAAGRGLAPAQYRLGSLYEKGQGVKKDIDQARRLYRSASEQGNAKAMHNLAVLYAEGIDGKPDLKLAGEWFRRAAARGIADSQYNLGILHARGLGVEQNLAESYKWFALAAQQGDQDAGKKRDDVAARLDRQALTAARLAVQTFTAEPQPEEAVSVKPPAGGWEASSGPATSPAPPVRHKPRSAPPRPKPALSAPQNIKPS
jgi:localization factor PodJL